MSRKSSHYYQSFKAADQVGITGRALGKIASSFMVITSDGVKNNLGLSLKFEAKALKVINYSRKEGRNWEYSQNTVDLIREYKEKFPEVFRVLDKSGDGKFLHMCKSPSILIPSQRWPRRRKFS